MVLRSGAAGGGGGGGGARAFAKAALGLLPAVRFKPGLFLRSPYYVWER